MTEIDRDRYAALYGPTVGDRVRLADTNLWIEVEEDRCMAGEEAVFGGGKTIRESMAQGSTTYAQGAPDTVITNVVVLDHWGIVKTDVGIRGGRISGLGKAGNPDIMDGVDPALRIGPTTDVISGEGRILTAGGVDCHVHFISPTIVTEALASGITTLIGGGTGPTEGTRATTCTPSPPSLADDAPCSRRPTSSTSCCWGRATRSARTASPSRRWPGRAASSCTRIGGRRRRRSTPACGRPSGSASRRRSTPTR